MACRRLLAACMAVCMAVCLAACGGGGSSPDAGAPDAANSTPAPPAPPAFPVLTPCPSGWREVPPADADEVATCDPWPATGEVTCAAADETHFPGEPGCTRIGSACPVGEWPEGLPAGPNILYVRAGGGPGGDGSQATPFGTIGEAMTVAPSGTIIALGKGTFNEVVLVGSGVTLWGACVAQTRIAASLPSTTDGSVSTGVAGTVLRNLQVGGERPGVWAHNAGVLDLEDVLIAGAAGGGINVTSGGRVTGHTVVVRDTRSRPADLTFGFGIIIQSAGQVELGRVVLERNRGVGVSVLAAGSSATFTDIAVRDTLSQESDLKLGRGFNVQAGAILSVDRGVVERNRNAGVFVLSSDATATLTDVVIRETQHAESDGFFGAGVKLQDGGHVNLTRVLVEQNRDVGVTVSGASASVVLTDVVIRDTQSTLANSPQGRFGRGINAQEGAHVDGSRVLVQRNRDAGVFAFGAGTSVALTDLVVRDTRSEESTLMQGSGLVITDGAQANVGRVLLERNHVAGVLVKGAGSLLTVTDVVIRDTRSMENNQHFGTALAVTEGSQAVVSRALIERNRDVSVQAVDPGTTLHLEDVIVRDTQDQECVPLGSCTWEDNTGVGAYSGAAITATRFLVTGNKLCGLQLALGGTMDLQDGEVSENPVGVNVQTVDFDLTRLQPNVVYRDNDVNFDASALPIPQ